MSERAIYNIVVRDEDDKITDTLNGVKKTEAMEFFRSLLSGMPYDEVTVQIHKRIPF